MLGSEQLDCQDIYSAGNDHHDMSNNLGKELPP